MIATAKAWTCDYCPMAFVQTGPRAASMPPVPPEGWFLVDITALVPEHTVKTPEGNVKVGDTLQVKRHAVCPGCTGRLAALVKERV